MKNLKIFILLFLFTIAACDTLDQVPVSIIDQTNFYKTASDAEAAILGVYANLRWFVSNNYIIPNSVRSDEGLAVRGGNWTRDERFQTRPVDGHVRDTWTACYATIGRANDVLDNVPIINDPNLTTEQRNKILGEAHFIRGFLHYHLVIRYGEIPYVTEAFNSPDQEYQPSREEVSTVYEKIIDDLLMAKELMPADPSVKVRANKWAAAAMLAKVYLQRNDSGDRALALAEINEVINSNGYRLVPAENYSDLFNPEQQRTVESIFELSFGPAGLADAAFDREMVASQNFRIGPETKLINAYKADSTLVVNSGKEEVRMAAALEHYYPVLDEEGNCILTCDPTDFPKNEYFVDKYTKDDWKKIVDRATLHPNVILLRLADLLLLKAEILNEQDDFDGAKLLLDQIRDRVNLPPSTATNKDELRLAIEDERYVELAFEGHRYWDLIRTGRATEVISNVDESGNIYAPTPEELLWPIPQADIDQNPNLLPQNPGYF